MRAIAPFYIFILVGALGFKIFPSSVDLSFPKKDQAFSTDLPVLMPGSLPRFPESDIILQERLYAPFVNLAGQNLSLKNLRLAHLSFANLSGTDLRGADLSLAILYGADLSGAKFNSATKLPFDLNTARALGMKEEP